MHLLDLLFPEDVKRFPLRLDQVRSGRELIVQRRLRRKDGSAVLVEMSAKQLPDGSLEAIARDITRRRDLEAGLVQADRLASVGVLAAGIAHEINNPLAYAIYNLESLRQDLADLEAEGDLRERLDAALEGMRRVREVVHDLETFSNVESDRQVPVDLRTVIDSALKLSSAEIRHRARVVTDYQETPLVRGSAPRLAQVFLNLIINAAQAIPEGHQSENEIRIVLGHRRVPGHGRGAGHGAGHLRRAPPTPVRPVLHHQTDRNRFRPRPQRVPQRRHGTWRQHRGRQHAGPGQLLQGEASGVGSSLAARRAPCRRRRRRHLQYACAC